MSTNWYVEHKGRTLGPITSSQLKQLAAQGKISPETNVRTSEAGNWSPASKVKGLFSQISIPSAPKQIVVREDNVEIVPTRSAPTTKSCPFCGETIAFSAIKCRHCNEFLDGRPRESSSHQSAPQPAAQPMINITQNTAVGYYYPRKSKMVAVLLAIFLGGLGMHHFYMGRTMRGLLYLLFCWTFIPAILSFLETFYYLLMSDENFQSRCR